MTAIPAETRAGYLPTLVRKVAVADAGGKEVPVPVCASGVEGPPFFIDKIPDSNGTGGETESEAIAALGAVAHHRFQRYFCSAFLWSTQNGVWKTFSTVL